MGNGLPAVQPNNSHACSTEVSVLQHGSLREYSLDAQYEFTCGDKAKDEQ